MGLTIFSMIVVDALNVHQVCVRDDNIDKDPETWISELAHKMIENNIDHVTTHSLTPNVYTPYPPPSNAGLPNPGLTPVKKRDKQGFSLQGWCKHPNCNKKSTFFCRSCTEEHEVQWYICSMRSGRNCWKLHENKYHPI